MYVSPPALKAAARTVWLRTWLHDRFICIVLLPLTELSYVKQAVSRFRVFKL